MPLFSNAKSPTVTGCVLLPPHFHVHDRQRVRHLWWLGLALAAAAAAQVTLMAAVPVQPEEAHHWNFGCHLDSSYFDHPPLLAWSIAIGRLLFGDTRVGVRFIPLLCDFGTIWLCARLAGQIYGEAAARWAVLMYALQPAAFLVGGWGFPDAPLLFFWMLTLSFVWQALQSERPGWWLAAGTGLGGALLSKYTAAFLVPSLLLYLLVSRDRRRWLATPWPYVACVVSLLVFAPVLYWNWAHDWASFRFQSVARFQAANRVSLIAGLQSTAEQWLLCAPVTLPLAVVTAWRGFRATEPGDQFLFWSFAPMAMFFFLMGWTPSFHVLWAVPAYLGLSVALAGAIASRSDSLSFFYWARWKTLVTVSTVMTFSVAIHCAFVVPFVPPLRAVYGWEEVVKRCRALRLPLAADCFYLGLGGRSYSCPSQLAFHLQEPFGVHGQEILGLDSLQSRFWSNPSELEGKDAIVVVEGGDVTGGFRERLQMFFRNVETAGDCEFPVGQLAPQYVRPVRFTFYRAWQYSAAVKEQQTQLSPRVE